MLLALRRWKLKEALVARLVVRGCKWHAIGRDVLTGLLGMLLLRHNSESLQSWAISLLFLFRFKRPILLRIRRFTSTRNFHCLLLVMAALHRSAVFGRDHHQIFTVMILEERPTQSGTIMALTLLHRLCTITLARTAGLPSAFRLDRPIGTPTCNLRILLEWVPLLPTTLICLSG